MAHPRGDPEADGYARLQMSHGRRSSSRGEPGVVGAPIFAFFFLTPFVFGATYYIFRGLFNIAESEYAQPTTVSLIAVPLLALAIGATLFWIREKLQNPYYAVVEIGVGMATAAQFVRVGLDDKIARVLLLLTGIRIIVDGINRFLRYTGLWKDEGRKASATSSRQAVP